MEKQGQTSRNNEKQAKRKTKKEQKRKTKKKKKKDKFDRDGVRKRVL